MARFYDAEVSNAILRPSPLCSTVGSWDTWNQQFHQGGGESVPHVAGMLRLLSPNIQRDSSMVPPVSIRNNDELPEPDCIIACLNHWAVFVSRVFCFVTNS